MEKLPEIVLEAWEKREGAVVLTTISKDGLPNSIYATCNARFGQNYFVVADNYFSKTRENILNGSKGSLLFITGDKKAYQLKGTIEYHTNGEIFDHMKTWNPEQHPGHAAAAVKVEEIYSGAEKLY